MTVCGPLLNGSCTYVVLARQCLRTNHRVRGSAWMSAARLYHSRTRRTTPTDTVARRDATGSVSVSCVFPVSAHSEACVPRQADRLCGRNAGSNRLNRCSCAKARQLLKEVCRHCTVSSGTRTQTSKTTSCPPRPRHQASRLTAPFISWCQGVCQVCFPLKPIHERAWRALFALVGDQE